MIDLSSLKYFIVYITMSWNAPSEVVRPLGYDCPTFRRTKRWLESERNQKILC